MSRYTRRAPLWAYRRRFFFITEGEETEKSYLDIAYDRLNLRELCTFCFRHDKSSIESMLTEALKVESSTKFKPKQGDEIWIILDQDEESHPPLQLKQLSAWEKEKEYRHVVISSPRFEYWLLWHFEQRPSRANSLSDTYVCNRVPNFKKIPLASPLFNSENIQIATTRATKSQYPTCDIPNVLGSGMGVLLSRLFNLR